MRAVVTAGTGGIGFEVARELAGRGYAVTVVGRDPERGEAADRRPRFIRADLSVPAEGPLQLLVNNLGGMWFESGGTPPTASRRASPSTTSPRRCGPRH